VQPGNSQPSAKNYKQRFFKRLIALAAARTAASKLQLGKGRLCPGDCDDAPILIGPPGLGCMLPQTRVGAV
jgi:hypothetical protein